MGWASSRLGVRLKLDQLAGLDLIDARCCGATVGLGAELTSPLPTTPPVSTASMVSSAFLMFSPVRSSPALSTFWMPWAMTCMVYQPWT